MTPGPSTVPSTTILCLCSSWPAYVLGCVDGMGLGCELGRAATILGARRLRRGVALWVVGASEPHSSARARSRPNISRPRPNRTLYGIRSIRRAAPSHSIEEHPPPSKARQQRPLAKEESKQRPPCVSLPFRSSHASKGACASSVHLWAPPPSQRPETLHAHHHFFNHWPQLHSTPFKQARQAAGRSSKSCVCVVVAAVSCFLLSTGFDHNGNSKAARSSNTAAMVRRRRPAASALALTALASLAAVGQAWVLPPAAQHHRCQQVRDPRGGIMKRRTVSIRTGPWHTICTQRNPTHGVTRRPPNRQ